MSSRSTSPVLHTAGDDTITEERLRFAVDSIRASGKRPSGGWKLSIRQAAKDFAVPKSTLHDRLNGKLTHEEAHIPQRKLTPAEEDILVAWTKVCIYTRNAKPDLHTMLGDGLPLRPSDAGTHS